MKPLSAIDDSLNGGGYVVLMGKLLALLSKDNKSFMYLRDETDNSIQLYTTRVDSNKDGEYDASDCYGNDFDFFIVTSSCSFSCGNAFPFYAQRADLARIVGFQKVVVNAVSLTALFQPDNPLLILLHIILVNTLKKMILMLVMKTAPSHGNK